MGKVILDAATRAKLNGLTQPTELYDENGTLLGYLTPVPNDCGLEALPRIEGNPFTDEEMRTAFDDRDAGRPLADILADLRKL